MAEYRTEAELCAEFITWVRDHNGGMSKGYEPWTAYPETGGFDILLVDEAGRQLGIEAKLRMNAKVLSQAMPSRWSNLGGPDWRGILVPACNADLSEIARAFGLIVFTPQTRYCNAPSFSPQLYESKSQFGGAWHDFNPPHDQRCKLPPMVPSVPAGVPSPVQLTPWKVGALKVLAHLATHGTVTAKEIRAYGIDPRRFCASDGWLKSEGNGQWSRGAVPAFDQQHPAEFSTFLAEAEANKTTRKQAA